MADKGAPPAGAFDAPVKHPHDDLLGMDEGAAKLATFLRAVAPPFTVGIFGQWGSGKTSFANLVLHQLEQASPSGQPKLKATSFTCWPYRTSDELWRALILQIAKVLYDVKDQHDQRMPGGRGEAPPRNEPVPAEDAPQGQKEQAQDVPGEVQSGDKPVPAEDAHQGQKGKAQDAPAATGLLPTLARWLGSDALVLRERPKPDPLPAGYRELVARLDDTTYGSVSKGDQQPWRLDEGGALLALAKAVAAALSPLSPLVAGLRGLLGLEGKVDLATLWRKENEAQRKRIESIWGFRQEMEDLFKQFQDVRLYVLIDDLDRCRPDVALDILDAISIFLAHSHCVFLLAVDERLIGQGLRLRHKDLLPDRAPTAEGQELAEELIQRRGQEYIEKTIQLGVPVAQRSAAEMQRFVGAQHPQWAAAADILQVAFGCNPRQCKQYCTWLTYQYLPEGAAHD